MQFDEFQQAVITSQDNILVIAGPGSGKTTTILEKVNYLLRQNSKANILLLSFTNKSVEDIKKRLTNQNVDVMTFHKLAIDILKNYNYAYQIANDQLLPYIIDEYFYQMAYQDINKLCRYLNILKFSKKSKEYQSLKKLIITFINLFKTNNHNFEQLKSVVHDYQDKYLIRIILDILDIYEKEKQSTNSLDFDDLIIRATYLLQKNYQYKKYDYLIIDEFQDTSLIRLNLIKEIFINSQSIITAVGDDAQSIFRFTGCDLGLFLNFTKHFPDSKILFLKNTYRNSQEIVDISSSFIEKNKAQLVKNMHSNINYPKPLEIINYYNPCHAFKKVLEQLINDNVMILSRNYHDIDKYIDHDFALNQDILSFHNKDFRYLTIHSAKGLESDYVIILNNEDSLYGLPNKLEDHPILKYLVTSEEQIPFAEERRLFFVGITRCKIKTYLLVPIKNPSPFVKEIKKLL